MTDAHGPAGPAAPRDVGLTIIEPRSGWQAIDVRQLWRFRELLLGLAARDLKLRYKQTTLGVIWVVLQPLLGAAIFAFVFGRVARLPSDGVPYVLFAFTGLLVWNVVSGIVSKAGTSLVTNAQLVRKVFFPRLLLPLSVVPSVLVDLGVGLAMTAVLMAMHAVSPGWSVLWLPLSVAVVLMLAVGAGLFVASLAVPYRDVQYITPVVLQLFLYASPIAYSVTAVPEDVRALYRLNPLVAPIEMFRTSLLGTPPPPPDALVYAVVVAAALLLGGMFAFRAMERTFVDVI
jgi:lipopolysaccharide transport system permease protein